jgi:hypothetical protein
MFEDARLKFQRSNDLFVELRAVLDEYLRSDFFFFDIEKNPNTGQNVLNFRVKREPPRKIATVLGDAIHNLRSAIDLAYVDLLRAIGETPSRWSTLRIYESREQLLNMLGKGRGILKNAPDVLAALAVKVRPYRDNGDWLLVALNDLDISDKHTSLIPVFAVVGLHLCTARIIPNQIIYDRCSCSVAENGICTLAVVGPEASFELLDKGEPIIKPFFGRGSVLSGRPLMDMLWPMSALPNMHVRIYEQLIAARNARPAS